MIDLPGDTEHERKWYRHKTTGDRAYIVEKDGVEHMRLDRPMQELLRPLKRDKDGGLKPWGQQDWIEDDTARSLTRAQAAQVAYVSDQQLCRFLGLHGEVKKDWSNLPDRERQDFIKNGPLTTDPIRLDLYGATMACLPTRR